MAGSAVGTLSRVTGRGAGSVVGGHAILAVEPRALERFSAGRRVVLVSGTNGKTTTTKLLASAMSSATGAPVVTNAAGANLPPGLAAVLAAGSAGAPAVLEVDEAWLGLVSKEVNPAVVVLLNLSRDQLDRNNEVRQVAARWQRACETLPPASVVVANADDPLVAWAAGPARRALWVGAGLSWTSDAGGCPRCGGQVRFADQVGFASAGRPAEGAMGAPGGWQCSSCGFGRPQPELWLEVSEGAGRAVEASRVVHELALRLPGRCNQANALIAMAAAQALGYDAGEALSAMAQVDEVAGRYATVRADGTTARLVLAKNPAGWAEVFSMLAPPPGPVVVAINARTADGHDPSWLWDVPFERLRGRRVVATGERYLDLATRLHYAGVDHVREPGLLAALTEAGPGRVDVVANYTAFHGYLRVSRRAVVAHQAPAAGRAAPAAGRAAPAVDGAAPAAGRAVPAVDGAAPAVDGAAPARATQPGRPERARARSSRRGLTTCTVALVYPDLLGTYGDAGNATVLSQRLRWRGYGAEVVTVAADQAVPESCELYVVGGGEDLPQALAASKLAESRALHRAAASGAVVLAVCAGLQILGESFPGADGEPVPGLGLLPCVSRVSSRPRAVGEILVRAAGRWADLGLLTGFENHGAVTQLSPGAEPVGTVCAGVGNEDGTYEGVVSGRVWGTYLHGPVLARNPRLADLLLSWVVGDLPPLEAGEAEALHAERAEHGPDERRSAEREEASLEARWWRRRQSAMAP